MCEGKGNLKRCDGNSLHVMLIYLKPHSLTVITSRFVLNAVKTELIYLSNKWEIIKFESKANGSPRLFNTLLLCDVIVEWPKAQIFLFSVLSQNRIKTMFIIFPIKMNNSNRAVLIARALSFPLWFSWWFPGFKVLPCWERPNNETFHTCLLWRAGGADIKI